MNTRLATEGLRNREFIGDVPILQPLERTLPVSRLYRESSDVQDTLSGKMLIDKLPLLGFLFQAQKNEGKIDVRRNSTCMRANIPVDTLSQPELLADWNWLLKSPCTLIAMTAFGDMFLRDENGTVQLLPLSTGNLTKIGDSQTEFQNLVADKQNQQVWFSLDLLTEIERSGLSLAAGQCFSFKTPLALGGGTELSNIEVAPISVYVPLMGQIHRQVRALPPGTPSLDSQSNRFQRF